MQKTFEYDKGVLVLLDEALYLTKSGNWSEVARLKEKTPKTGRIQKLKAASLLLLPIASIAFAGIGMSKDVNDESGLVVYLIAAVGLLTILARWAIIQSKAGIRIKVPYSKIKYIRVFKYEIDIYFWDTEGNACTERVESFYLNEIENIISLLNNRVQFKEVNKE